MIPAIGNQFRYQDNDLPFRVFVPDLEHVIDKRIEDVAVWRWELN